MRGRPLVLTIILSILVGGIVFGVLKSDLFGDNAGKRVNESSSVSVPQILPLEQTEIPVVIGINGRVLPERKVVIKPQVSGSVEEVLFEVDQEVKKDQVLFRINNRLASIDLVDQKAALESRKVEAEDAVWELNRKELLHKDAHVSEDELEAAQLRVKTTAIALLRQGEAVKRAQKILSDYEVRAPWAGVVLQKWVTIGTYVRTGDPSAELLDLSQMQIEIGLTQDAMLQVRRGKESGTLALESSTGSIEIEDTRMVLEATPVTRTYPVRFLVQNQKENLMYPGMSLRMEIHTGVRDRGFYIPSEALITRADRSYLWMVKKGRASLSPVRVTARHGDRIRIEGDFQEGERVIIARGQELKDGQEIDFAPAAAER
jgi:RND family efflux transporter MFP subunit